MNDSKRNSTSLQKHILDIYKTYPSIFRFEQVSTCSKIYYPISIVDVVVEEQVQQPFSTIEQLIIELILAGTNNVEDFVKAIGLPSLFIEGIINELEAQEFIDDFKLTTKGEYSYSQKLKYIIQVNKQKLHYDPILETVIQSDSILDEYLVPIQVTNHAVPHFLPKSHLHLNDLDMIFDAVPDADMNMRQKHIKEVLTIQTYYVEATLLQFNLVPHPYIFFSNEVGEHTNLLTISEANLSYFTESKDHLKVISRTKYFDVWQFNKQIKDDIKKKQDNQILRKDIIAKVSQRIKFSQEQHTIITDSGISIVLEFTSSFELSKAHFDALCSLEWVSRHIPFFALEDDDEYSSFIFQSECYERKAREISKILFELEYEWVDREALYTKVLNIIKNKQGGFTTLNELLNIVVNLQTNKKSS